MSSVQQPGSFNLARVENSVSKKGKEYTSLPKAVDAYVDKYNQLDLPAPKFALWRFDVVGEWEWQSWDDLIKLGWIKWVPTNKLEACYGDC